MPCSDSGPSWEEVERRNKDLDTMARLACDRCKWLEASGMVIPAWAYDWWFRHKEEDRVKSIQELASLHNKKIRDAALEKLSSEERDALGL